MPVSTGRNIAADPPDTLPAEDLEVPWEVFALCSQTDPELFFPEKGGTTGPAKKLCQVCPVRSKCLAAALGGDEPFGIWGGLSARDRVGLRRVAEVSGLGFAEVVALLDVAAAAGVSASVAAAALKGPGDVVVDDRADDDIDDGDDDGDIDEISAAAAPPAGCADLVVTLNQRVAARAAA